MRAYLGLGSNLQNPVEQLREAICRLKEAGGVEVLRCSSFYSTPPWGDVQQDNFINAAVEVETSLSPLELLAETQAIESRMGRVRGKRRWGPRVIDIDLLLYGDETFLTANLEIPHPRMHERAFVLVPLAEIDESLPIPGHGRLGELLQNIDRSGICRIPRGVSS